MLYFTAFANSVNPWFPAGAQIHTEYLGKSYFNFHPVNPHKTHLSCALVWSAERWWPGRQVSGSGRANPGPQPSCPIVEQVLSRNHFKSGFSFRHGCDHSWFLRCGKSLWTTHTSFPLMPTKSAFEKVCHTRLHHRPPERVVTMKVYEKYLEVGAKRQKCRITFRHLWPSNSALRNQLVGPLFQPFSTSQLSQPIPNQIFQ